MTLGEKIKHLRQKNDVTQEKLAEYLNITYQSVSKWENNNALPDISLVVPLANFFGVTIDELFDRDADMQAAELKEYDDRDYELSHRKSVETIRERVALWREAVQKYPRNFRCLEMLAYALFDTLDRAFEEPYYQANAKEVISVCERILRDCTDNSVRESAIQILVYTYARPYLAVADEGKAEAYAKMAGSYYVSREILLEQAYFSEEGRRKGLACQHHNNLAFMDFICGNITGMCRNLPPEEAVFCYETAVRLWETLIYDGNFLFYHGRLAPYCFYLAKNYALLGRRDETLAALRKAMQHAKAYDSLPIGEQQYTSLFVREAGSANPFPNDNTEWNRNFLAQDCFDFLRGDPEFIALLP